MVFCVGSAWLDGVTSPDCVLRGDVEGLSSAEGHTMLGNKKNL